MTNLHAVAVIVALVVLGITGTISGDVILPALTGIVGLAAPSPIRRSEP